jgi:hypothetical protein
VSGAGNAQSNSGVQARFEFTARKVTNGDQVVARRGHFRFEATDKDARGPVRILLEDVRTVRVSDSKGAFTGRAVLTFTRTNGERVVRRGTVRVLVEDHATATPASPDTIAVVFEPANDAATTYRFAGALTKGDLSVKIVVRSSNP